MIKLREINFQAISKMSMSKRLKAFEGVKNGGLSYTMFSALTPTQFAELFPKSYRDHNPDIGGFLKAMPTSLTSAQQAARERQLAQTASGSAGGSDFDSRGYVKDYKENVQRVKSAHVGSGYVKPPPQLSPEQKLAFDSLVSGDNAVNSDLMKKTFGGLTDAQLADLGISKRKTDSGEVLHYEKPTLSDEQATSRLKNGGGGGVGTNTDKSRNAAEAYQAARAEGLSESAARALVGNMSGEALATPSIVNKDVHGDGSFAHMARGIVQWDPKRSEDIRAHFGKYPNEMSVAEQTKAAIWELKTNYAGSWKTLNDDSLPIGQRVRYLVDHYEIAAENLRDRTSADRTSFANSMQTGPVAPQGPDGQYSKEQLDKVKEDYYREQNQARQQKLAAFLQSQGVDVSAGPTGTVSYGQSKDFSEHIMFSKSNGQCAEGARKMAGHMFSNDYFFNNSIPNAARVGSSGYYEKSGLFNGAKNASRDDLSNQAYLDSLPIGTVVSVGGGKVGKSGESLGHVQIKIGPNKWASDFPQSGVLLHRKSGPDYDGNYKVFVPNETGLERLKQNGVSQNYTPSSRESSANSESRQGPRVNTQSVDVPAVEDSGSKSEHINFKSGNNVQPEGQANVSVDGKPGAQPTPGVGPSTMPNAPQAPGTERINMKAGDNVQPEGSAQVSVTKKETAAAPKGTSFTFSKENYLNEVARAHPEIDTLGALVGKDRNYAWRETLKGLKEAEANGVLTFDEKTGKMVINDMNHPQVQNILKEMKDNGLNKDAFLKQQEEKKKAEAEAKKEPPKITPTEPPKPATPAPSTPAPTHEGQGKTGASGTPGGGGGKGKDGEPGKSDAATAKPVPTASKGGDFNVGSQDLIAKPIGSLNGDNVIVGSKEGNPMFTMKASEDLTVKNGVASVRPKSKDSNIGPLPPVQPMIDMSASAPDNPGLKVKPSFGQPDQVSAQYSPNAIANEIAEASKPIARNETAYRAFARTNFVDTGSPIGGHYTYGDQNLK